MSRKEINRLEVIKKYLVKRLSQAQAASQLSISERHFRRLLKQFKQHGVDALISKRRGQPSNRQIPSAVRKQALDLIGRYYSDFGPTFAHEKLRQCHSDVFECPFSVETLRHWMIEDGFHKTKRRGVPQVHQSRPRRSCFGEMIQVDGSTHDWFEGRGEPCTLIAFIDDATSHVTAAYFCKAETTFNYMHCLQTHLKRYGCPISIYSDRHSIFHNNAKETHTLQQPSQFARASNQLNIYLIVAYSPQAKGRIERLFKTFQDRLVKEMRLQGISTIEQANEFLADYIVKFNQRFSKKPRDSSDSHRPIPCSEQELELILSKQSVRKLSKNLICQYHNTQYLVTAKKPSYALQGARITICEKPDGEIILLYKNRRLPYILHQQQPPLPEPEDAKTINSAVDKILGKHSNPPRPVSTHPWRRWNPDYLRGSPK